MIEFQHDIVENLWKLIAKKFNLLMLLHDKLLELSISYSIYCIMTKQTVH